MLLTTAPQALPGTCLLCPRSVRSRFIDTEIQIEWYGAIILCDLCVTEMGRMIGMLSTDQVDDLKNDNNILRDRIFELERKLAGLEAIRDGLALAGYQLPDSARLLAVPPSHGERSAEGSRAPAGDVGAQGGAAPESVHDEGLAELRSDERSDAGSILNI